MAPGDAGHVDQDVYAAERSDGPLDQRGARVLAADIGLHRDTPETAGGNGPFGVRQAIFQHIGQRHRDPH